MTEVARNDRGGLGINWICSIIECERLPITKELQDFVSGAGAEALQVEGYVGKA